jgi:hypothetical protein
MASTIFDFFCKKKYKTILMVHKNDKKMYEILEQSSCLNVRSFIGWICDMDQGQMLKIKFPQLP